MTDVLDEELLRRTWDLLQPGEIELDGLIVHSEFDSSQEAEMHRATVEVGQLIAEYAGFDPDDTFVYSGTDDADFSSNQHQGLTLADESFVWECQQLLRDGTFDLVFYYEADANSEGLLDAVRDRGYTASHVPGDSDGPPADSTE